MNLGATLYVNDSSSAAAFYMEAFEMTMGYSVRNPDGTFLHAELLKDGRSIFALSESSDSAIADAMLNSSRPTMSYGIDLENEDALETAYGMLADGGKVLRPLGALPWSPCSADVIDRYGVCWYLYVSQEKPTDSAMNEWFANNSPN